jgi:peptidoglycan hydrolase CwlO-like protein
MKEEDPSPCIPSLEVENQFKCVDGSSKEIEGKLNDIHKWKRNQKKELRYNITQTHELLKLKETVEAMVKDIQAPLNITQENVYSRESRPVQEPGGDVVGDSLLLELETFRKCEKSLLEKVEKITDQLTKLRAARQELEADIKSKKDAKQNDNCVKLLCALSKEIGGLKMPENKIVQQSSSSWLQNSQALIQKSQVERDAARVLHAQVNRAMLDWSDQCFGVWYETNACLHSKIKEISAEVGFVQEQYSKTTIDINELSCRINEVRKLLDEQAPALKLVKARVEKKIQRPGLELCQDKTIMALLRAMNSMQKDVEKLTSQLKELEGTMEDLRKSNRLLEKDLRLKNINLFIHREKCLHLRQNFPISTFKNAKHPSFCNPVLPQNKA